MIKYLRKAIRIILENIEKLSFLQGLILLYKNVIKITNQNKFIVEVRIQIL